MSSDNHKNYALNLLRGLSLFFFYSGWGRIAKTGFDGGPEKETGKGRDGRHVASRNLLPSEFKDFKSRCKNCRICVKDCAFLREYGTPGEILERLDPGRPEDWKIAFECSLCNFCQAICPQKLDTATLFLQMRRQAVAEGFVDLSAYAPILKYEKLGGSALFSYYGIPSGCDTIFFPGCAFPGTRPEIAWRTFRYLREHIPRIGVVLDCCAKPSHDLGRQEYFEEAFGKVLRRLEHAGVRNVLVNCPNCYRTFRQYGDGLRVGTVYEAIGENRIPEIESPVGTVALHDPCPMRTESGVQAAVRKIVAGAGFSLEKMKHAGERAICCGEGGSVGFVRPDFKRKWADMRKNECNGSQMVSYCAACAASLDGETPALHLLDLLFSSPKSLERKNGASKPPFTYINRLRLKRRFKNLLRRGESRAS